MSTYGHCPRDLRLSWVSIFAVAGFMSTGLTNLDVKRFKVVVTDDEVSVRRSLQLLLHANGYEAQSYTSASALLADRDALSADCVIADYNMPDIDGLSLIKALRANGWSGAAILITAYCSDDLTQRAKASGYTEVIAKPFIRRPILERISTCLNRRGDSLCRHFLIQNACW